LLQEQAPAKGCLALRAHSPKSLNFNATRAALTVQ